MLISPLACYPVRFERHQDLLIPDFVEVEKIWVEGLVQALNILTWSAVRYSVGIHLQKKFFGEVFIIEEIGRKAIQYEFKVSYVF